MDFKDRMIEAVERGWTDEAHAYEYVRESLADQADLARKRGKEEPSAPSEGSSDTEGPTGVAGFLSGRYR